jgi:thiamine-phosphate diphosphorylase
VSGPELTLVTDSLRSRDLVALAKHCARAGVDTFQVREKNLTDAELRDLVLRIVAAVKGTGTRVLVNSRPDVAELCGAAGVQLPELGLPVREVRRFFPALRIGASRHSLEGALEAEAEGADFVVLGPVFATPGKEERALGRGVLARAASSLHIGVHAIGGIDAKTAPLALQAGARGLCAIRAFLQEPIEAVVSSLRGRS